jgi:hypothetical protein
VRATMIVTILSDFSGVGGGVGGATVGAVTDGEEVTALRSAIAIIMAVLGTVLVLSGAAALWASALVRPGAAEPGGRIERTVGVVGRLPIPDRLITWGVVLLALSAVAAGAITLSATATAGG